MNLTKKWGCRTFQQPLTPLKNPKTYEETQLDNKFTKYFNTSLIIYMKISKSFVNVNCLMTRTVPVMELV
jgi:hypothetical protein